MITNNSNNNYVFLNVFMFQIMSMTLMNINPQKEIFHHYDFKVSEPEIRHLSANHPEICLVGNCTVTTWEDTRYLLHTVTV